MYDESEKDLVRGEIDNISDTSSNSTIFQAGLTDKELAESVDRIIEQNQRLVPHKELIYRGAVLANDEGNVLDEHRHHYNDAEIDQLAFESKHSIRAQSWTMFLVALSSCLSAVNFGHDESAVSGAQLDYIFNCSISPMQMFKAQLMQRLIWLQGLLVSDLPYF